MIVVDTNVIAYLFLPSPYTAHAEKLFELDQDWVAPQLWRSEFRNVLSLYMRKEQMSYEKALEFQTQAESLMKGKEYDIESFSVLTLIHQSQCSAYDCEFISLAMQLKTKLYTMDKKLIREFPQVTRFLKEIEL